jgi:hypothetical protein
MALVSCRECNGQVSDQAPACPHCGAPVSWKAEFRGWGFEWSSRTKVAGWPLVHVAFGRRPDGRLRVAKGVIAIGQFGVGAVTFAQFGVGFVFGFGQFMVGAVAVAQMAVSLLFALGQFAAAWVAVGQVVLAYFGLGQMGLAHHLWSSGAADPEAIRFFCEGARELGLPWTLERCAGAPALEMSP